MTARTSSAGAILRACGVAAMIAAWPALAQGAATIVILNANAPGVGFNDPTPAAPVGGNPGTTLGQQRLNAFQAAAGIWGATLDSSITIVVQASLEPLTCNATSAVLGSAGAAWISRDFPGAPLPATWYHGALANARLGIDDAPELPEIVARFNSNLGNVGCLTGVPFYLGLDNNHGTAIDLVTVLLHEFGHGLGFQTFTSSATGALYLGYASAYDHFLFDITRNLPWLSMTNAERAASAQNTRRLVWTGANVSDAVPLVLQPGTPNLVGLSPGSLAREFLIGRATFGAPLAPGGLTGEVMPVVDQPDGTGFACTPLSPANALAVNGKIALIDRGVCTFVEKAKIVQDAGAIAAIIVDNVTGSPPPDLTGADPAIVIPSVRITLADGAAFKTSLRTRSRTRSGVVVRMELDLSRYAGADAAGRALMYTPSPLQSGSSVSHYDTLAFPNQLMEPSFSPDLIHAVTPPRDLTFPLLKDLGWNP